MHRYLKKKSLGHKEVKTFSRVKCRWDARKCLNFLKLRSCGTLLPASHWRFSCEIFLQPLSYQISKWIYLLVKLRYSKKATKFVKNLFDIVEDFFRILLPSQNIWTLMIFLFIKNGLVKKHLIKSVCKKSPNPIHITAFLCVKSDIEPRAMSWATKKEETDPCFFTTTFTDVNFAKWQMICLNSSFIV